MREVTVGFFHNNYGKWSPDRFLDSIRRVYPDSEVINCAIPCEEKYAMAVRTQCYADLRKKTRGNLILCDTDVEALKPVDIWDEGFHVGLTRTRKAVPLMPFNGGMIFLKDTPHAQVFMEEVARCATIVPSDFGERTWYLDQLALGYVAKYSPVLKEFPEEYNYVPKTPDDRPDVYFIHYKGNRKSWL